MNQNKLSKDQIQKLALSALGFFALVYVYFSFFLGPLNKSRASAQATIAELQQKLDSSKSEMVKANNLEQQASTAMARFAAYKSLSPEGAPIAWFPPRMKLFFANQQVEKSTVRMESSSPFKQPELGEWVKYTWLVDLPQTDFFTLGKAIAELENTEPLLSTARLSIRAVADDPQFQQVSLTVASAILKR